jgi:hypothetical protein
MEAKYIACFAATQDAIWLKSFIYHLKIIKLTLIQWQFTVITLL